MTINATAAWLLGLYVANAEEQGVATAELRGTTQNDIVKEYLSRGHLHLPARAEPPADRRHGRLLRRPRAAVEPDERLQLPPAGGGGDAGAGDRLRAGHRHRRARRGARLGPGRARAASPTWSASISFFVNAGIRFVEEICKMRAFTELWDRICLERYGVTTRRRAASATACRSTASGSPRPSPRTTCSASCSRCWASRCRSGPGPARSSSRRGTRRSACPGRGTSSGRCACSRCWPTRPTCSSTTTSSTAPTVVEARTAELVEAAQAELDDVLALGGAFEAIDELKGRLVPVAGRADAAHRVRRAGRGRRQPLHRDGAVAARRRGQRSCASTRRSRPS